jgi:hypothetical protein
MVLCEQGAGGLMGDSFWKETKEQKRRIEWQDELIGRVGIH